MTNNPPKIRFNHRGLDAQVFVDDEFIGSVYSLPRKNKLNAWGIYLVETEGLWMSQAVTKDQAIAILYESWQTCQRCVG